LARKKQDKAVEETPIVQSDTPVDEQYVLKFAQAMSNIFGNPAIFNPIWQNEILKSMNMTPHKYDRDKVKELLRDPRNNEKQLKDLSQFLFNFIMEYKQLVTYYANMLSFDWYLYPTNADAEDMKTKAFERSHKKALNWIKDFDLKTEAPLISTSMMLEDAKFYYLRESENGIRLQEMPSDFCKIYAKNDLGYQYAFNLTYFLQPAVDIDSFAPEFKEYFNAFLGSDEYKNNKKAISANRYYYWQKLDPAKAWVFKYDQIRAGINPPLMGLFLDAIEISTYKELLKTKTSLDVWKVIINKIPLQSDSKSGKKDDFAILAPTAASFSQIMQAAMPQGVRVLTSPLDAQPIDFKSSETKDSIVGLGSNEFWKTSGGAIDLFGSGGLNGSGLQASIKTDSLFVKNIYKQFERFINFQLKQITGKYRFRIVLEGTEYDRQERFDRAMQVAPYGLPLTYVVSAMGKTQDELNSLVDFEDYLNFKDRMKPMQSAHVQSGKDNQGGRPEKNVNDLTASGEKTKENESNTNR
jgi:hypothetical protein